MMVFANSILRAKQFASMPTPLEMEVMGPTEAHNGNGAVWQKPVKSPKGMMVFDDRQSALFGK